MKTIRIDGKVYEIITVAVIAKDEATGKSYYKGEKEVLRYSPEYDFSDRNTMKSNPTEKAPSFKSRWR